MQAPEEPSLETFSNDLVEVKVHRKAPCQVELDVKASQKLLEQARANAIKEVSKEVTLPGFRKGKAPEDLVLKKYAGDIQNRLHKAIADLAYVEAQKLAKAPLLNNNAKIVFDMKKLEEGSATLSYVFDTEPSPPEVDSKKFSPKPIEQKEVGEKEIDEGVRQMAFFYAKWEPVEDRGIEEGDFIIIDLDTLEGEQPTRVFNQVRFEVKAERMAKWMQDLVLGAKVGDQLEGVSQVDEGATEAEKAEFQPKKVRLHILKAEKAALPEINDEFAKNVGSKDVAGMREMIQTILKTQVQEKVDRERRNQINQFLIQEYTFDLPNSLVDAEFEHRLSQALKNPETQKHWDSISEQEKEEIRKRVREEATQSLSLFYLARKIVQDAGISISHQEVQNAAAEMKRQNPMAAQTKAGEPLSREDYAVALSSVVLAKAQDYILNAKAPFRESSEP